MMGDDVETLQRALDALPADRVAHIKSLKEPWDKGVAKMKHWVGAEVVGICGALADELDFMKSLVRVAHEASCSLSSDGALHSFRTLPMNVTAKRRCTALLPMVVAAEARKDLATPRTADSTMRHRLKKRGVRERKSIALQMTQAMRARMQEPLPDNAANKMRFIWNRVQQPMPKPPDLSSVLCGLCWATCSEYCPCGAEMVGSHDASALDEFGSFVFAPKNPMLRMWDPEDQRWLLASLRVSCENPREGFQEAESIARVGRPVQPGGFDRSGQHSGACWRGMRQYELAGFACRNRRHDRRGDAHLPRWTTSWRDTDVRYCHDGRSD